MDGRLGQEDEGQEDEEGREGTEAEPALGGRLLNTRLRDRFRGALLGAFVGDSLGMAVEGLDWHEIRRRHGELRELQHARLGRGTYTDDTEMMIGLAEGLLAGAPGEPVDLDEVARAFAAHLDLRRGYGGNARRVLAAIRGGEPWARAARTFKPPGGSWGNGAAMRVAPVALAYYPDAAATGRAAVEQAAISGHDHPLGAQGARLQALAVLYALRCGAAGAPFDLGVLTAEVGPSLPTEYREALAWIAAHPSADIAIAASRFDRGVAAPESVPAALWAFVACPESPEEAIVRAVALGRDTDTIGAMAGAISGAYHGASALPARWLDLLENGPRGRDYVIEQADRLCERATSLEES